MSTSLPEIEAIAAAYKRDITSFRVGDNIKVHYRIKEGDKERIQVFQGVVIRQRRAGIGSTFTVRKVSYGVGVERIFPENSPRIEKIEVTARGHVRRSKLYYLRELRGKKARLRASQKSSADEVRSNG